MSIINYNPIKKYLGDDGFKGLKELYFYYKNKIQSQFLDSDFHKKVIKQMERCVCKIRVLNMQCTEFFCKVPFPNKKEYFKVLITVNHCINESILNKKEKLIYIDIKDCEDIIKLDLNNRMTYTNEKYDSTMIEIKEEDKITDYLEIDNHILNNEIYGKNLNEEYKNSGIYMIEYPEGELAISFGFVVESSSEKKYEFEYYCETSFGSSGSPVLNLNNKVIGMHKGDHKYLLIAQFINSPIKEFIEKNYMNIGNPPFDDKQVEYRNLLKKSLGSEIYKHLDELYLSFRNSIQ